MRFRLTSMGLPRPSVAAPATRSTPCASRRRMVRWKAPWVVTRRRPFARSSKERPSRACLSGHSRLRSRRSTYVLRVQASWSPETGGFSPQNAATGLSSRKRCQPRDMGCSSPRRVGVNPRSERSLSWSLYRCFGTVRPLVRWFSVRVVLRGTRWPATSGPKGFGEPGSEVRGVCSGVSWIAEVDERHVALAQRRTAVLGESLGLDESRAPNACRKPVQGGQALAAVAVDPLASRR